MSYLPFADNAETVMKGWSPRPSWLLALLLGWMVPICPAAVGPAPASYSLPVLFDAAEAVCAGTVVGAHEFDSEDASTQPAARRFSTLFKLSEPRCYKGVLEESDAIQYLADSPGIPSSQYVQDRETVIVFLRRTSAATWGLADPYFGRIYTAPLGGLPLPSTGGLAQLELDLESTLRTEHDPNLLTMDLQMLHGFDRLSPVTVALVRALTNSPEPLVAVGAFAVLAKIGAPDDLSQFCDYLMAHEDRISVAVLGFNFTSIEHIRLRTYRPALECLANTAPISVRSSAMIGIRGMADQASIPELVRHLDDSDSYIQYLAVITLWEIVPQSGQPGPTMQRFDRDPTQFTISWKRWWNEYGRAHYSGPEQIKKLMP
jgi:hypothetical protein